MLHLRFFPRGAGGTLRLKPSWRCTHVCKSTPPQHQSQFPRRRSLTSTHPQQLHTSATSCHVSMPSLISHPTPSAASPPIWHPLLSGERANMQFTPLHILTTFTDAGWSTELFNQDTDGSASSRTQNWRSTDKHFIKPVCVHFDCVGWRL